MTESFPCPTCGHEVHAYAGKLDWLQGHEMRGKVRLHICLNCDEPLLRANDAHSQWAVDATPHAPVPDDGPDE